MKLFSFILLLTIINIHGQTIMTSSNLKGEWFVANTDSSFFKSDTLVLIKRTNKEKDESLKIKDRDFIEPSYELVKSPDYLNLKFQNSNKAHLWKSFQGGYYNEFLNGPFTWNIKNDILTLSSFNFSWKFRTIAKGMVTFQNLVANVPTNQYETLSTDKIILVRIK